MKINAKIVGIGQTRSGTAKNSGRPYSFTPVSFIYRDPDISGYAAVTVNVDSPVYNDHPVRPDDEVTMVVHNQNFRLYVDAIL